MENINDSNLIENIKIKIRTRSVRIPQLFCLLLFCCLWPEGRPFFSSTWQSWQPSEDAIDRQWCDNVSHNNAFNRLYRTYIVCLQVSIFPSDIFHKSLDALNCQFKFHVPISFVTLYLIIKKFFFNYSKTKHCLVV